MTYSTTPDGKIINNVNGQEVEVDISSIDYQNYRYWVSHKVNLTTPIVVDGSAKVVDELVVEPAVEPTKETLIEQVEDEITKLEEKVVKFVKG